MRISHRRLTLWLSRCSGRTWSGVCNNALPAWMSRSLDSHCHRLPDQNLHGPKEGIMNAVRLLPRFLAMSIVGIFCSSVALAQDSSRLLESSDDVRAMPKVTVSPDPSIREFQRLRQAGDDVGLRALEQQWRLGSSAVGGESSAPRFLRSTRTIGGSGVPVGNSGSGTNGPAGDFDSHFGGDEKVRPSNFSSWGVQSVHGFGRHRRSLRRLAGRRPWR